jgi:hypothetical protein
MILDKGSKKGTLKKIYGKEEEFEEACPFLPIVVFR